MYAVLKVEMFYNIISYIPYSTKLWQWKTLADLVVRNQFAKILSFILAILLRKAANPPMFYLPKCLLATIRQSFVSYGIQYTI